MNALKLLQSCYKPYKGFSFLPEGNHEIVKFKMVNNKMYDPESETPQLKRVVLVELKEEVLFLPEYFAINFQKENEKLLDSLNEDGVKKYLYFGGKRESG